MYKMLANDDSRDKLVNAMAITAIVVMLLTLSAFVAFIDGSLFAINTNKKTEIVTTKNSNIKANNEKDKITDESAEYNKVEAVNILQKGFL